MPKITRSLLNKISNPDKRTYLWDDALKGFGVHLTPKGSKSYIYQYRTLTGTSRRYKIGSYPNLSPEDARRRVLEIAAKVSRGLDPMEERKESRNAECFKDFADRYLAEHARNHKKETSANEDERLLNTSINPVLGKKRLVEIKPKEVQSLHLKLAETPYLANRVLSLLKTMFNLAEDWGLRPNHSNPCRRIKAFKEEKRQRFLSPDELKRIWVALQELEGQGKISAFAAVAIRLLVFTGARKSEVLNLQWSEVDFENHQVNLQDSKTGKKTIHLSTHARRLLKEIPRVEGNPFVCVGQKDNRPLTDIKKPWRKLLDVAEIDGLRLHDLRHSFAAFAASDGQSLHMIGGLLGHTQAQTTARYAHLASDPLKVANERVSALIQGAFSAQ